MTNDMHPQTFATLFATTVCVVHNINFIDSMYIE